MNMHSRIELPFGADHWANNGADIPTWVRDKMCGSVSSNGTFLIETPVGPARVHIGHIVIRHRSDLWCRTVAEVPELIAGLEAVSQMEVTAIGPGKAAQFGTKSRRGQSSAAKAKSFPEALGSPPMIEWIRPHDLSVDPSYKRSIENEASRRLIASIASKFDWRLFAPLIASRRPDGSKVIIDGQHRWAAALRRGDLAHLPCCLFSYETPEEEARMFIVANRARKPMNRLDDFYAAVAAADEDALEIRRLVSEAGLTVARQMSVAARRPGEISFTSSIAAALRRQGEAVVSAALTSMSEAFAGEVVAQGSSVFNALVQLFAAPPADFDPDELVPALRKVNSDGFQHIIRDLQGSEARADALRIAILSALDIDKRQALAA